MSYQFSSEENKLFSSVSESYYMSPIIDNINQYIGKYGAEKSFDFLHDILRDSQKDVERILEQRRDDGKIKDVSQARKTVVGSAFTNSIIYIFLKCKEQGIVYENIFITNKTKDKIFQELVTINVGDETQKPDMDLIVYSFNQDGSMKKCMIISAKTSLRERAGQTYKWKLLMEIATTPNSIREKYAISYNAKNMPLVCFATVNFYNEINNPQHRGMFKFFDSSFIGKQVGSEFIKEMSGLVSYVNKNLN